MNMVMPSSMVPLSHRLAVRDRPAVILGEMVKPASLERVLRRRDGEACRFPGCQASRGTQCHHLVRWADGGPTDRSNLVTLCRAHHHLIHDQGWSMGGDPDRLGGLWVRRPDGSQLPGQPGTLDTDIAEGLLGVTGSCALSRRESPISLGHWRKAGWCGWLASPRRGSRARDRRGKLQEVDPVAIRTVGLPDSLRGLGALSVPCQHR